MAFFNALTISKIASVAASAMHAGRIVNDFLPPHFRHLLLSRFCNFFSRFSSRRSVVVEEYDEFVVSRLYEAAEVYLSTRISPSNTRLKVDKQDWEKGFRVTMDKGEEIVDVFDGFKVTWRSVCTKTEKRVPNSHGGSSMRETRYFELSFDKIHRDKVAQAKKDENTPVKIFNLSERYRCGDRNGLWSSVVLDHPSTFETLAMEESQKAAIMNDLKKFTERKQLYRKVGKAWKRGYLLYGPPGTGKSSLIGSMANFLKFDIYDLELTDVCRNSDLKILLMATSNRSMLVIEDIDCTKELKDRNGSGDQAVVPSRRREQERESISKIASVAASAMHASRIVNDFLPPHFRHLLLSRFCNFFSHFSSRRSVVVEEYDEFAVNRLYEAAEVYLSTRISPSNTRLKVGKQDWEKGFRVTMDKGEEIVDVFNGFKVTWRSVCTKTEKRVPNSHGGSSMRETRYFELSFDKIHRDKVLSSYFAHVLDKAQAIKDENTPVKIFNLSEMYRCGDCNGLWSSFVLDHPSTFETLAMEESQKAAIMNDLKKFTERKQLYRKVGNAWKRGYLLYVALGTGKSSLIGAMANFLKFDIYDLELTDVRRNSDLKNLLMATSNRSMLVIEDIDCTKELKDRNGSDRVSLVMLSGFLNFIDGMWSSCGDERVIVFTTNHKEKLDPALLRPGRMDMHIHMGYCSFSGSRIMASNYLGIHDHPMFVQVKDIMQKLQITPAEIGEAFMGSELENPTVALHGVIDARRGKEKEKEEEKEKEKHNML
ncbi:HYPER-SENSITIVITY-RELATED 4 protein [Nymphaea thermarum]|nr:HYPER-SENSITIVITY-RELATED 4 protein [Nymphaea thermarum]